MPIGRRYVEEFLFAFLATIVSTIFVLSYIHYAVVEPRATIPMLTSFSAHLPFQARLLSIIIVKYIPIKVYLLAIVLGLVYSFRRLAGYFEVNHVFSSFSIFLPLFANYVGISRLNILYPYDLPAILLFTLGLDAILRKRLLNYYVVYLLALLNRETGVFLAIVFGLILAYSMTRTKILIHLLGQLLLAAVLRTIVLVIFRDSPGEVVELKLFENVDALFHPTLIPTVILVSAFGGLWIVPIIMFRSIDVTMRKVVFVLPVILACMFVVGNPTELRIYSEAVPIVTLAAISAISGIHMADRKLQE